MNRQKLLKALQALELIDEENKVTEEGISILWKSITDANEKVANEEKKEWKPEYIQTFDKDEEEWEKENHGVVIGGYGDEVLEVSPTKMYHLEEGIKVWDRQEILWLGMCDVNTETDFSMTLGNKYDIIKLRDYLTRFIEKDEEWGIYE